MTFIHIINWFASTGSVWHPNCIQPNATNLNTILHRYTEALRCLCSRIRSAWHGLPFFDCSWNTVHRLLFPFVRAAVRIFFVTLGYIHPVPLFSPRPPAHRFFIALLRWHCVRSICSKFQSEFRQSSPTKDIYFMISHKSKIEKFTTGRPISHTIECEWEWKRTCHVHCTLQWEQICSAEQDFVPVAHTIYARGYEECRRGQRKSVDAEKLGDFFTTVYEFAISCAVNKSCFCQVISEWIYRNEICLIFIALETKRACAQKKNT